MRIAALALVVLCQACGSASNLSDRIAGHRASPFALFGRDDMRAGLRYDVLRDAARKESVKQFECVPLWAKSQRCSLAIESGMLVAVLDSTNRIIRLLATTDPAIRNGLDVHAQFLFREVVRDTRTAWDSSGNLHRDDSEPSSPQLRWLDRTQRWAASLWYSRAHRADAPRLPSTTTDAELTMSLPESLGVTDLPAYALFVQLRPAPSASPPAARLDSARQRDLTSEEIITMLRSDLRELTIAEEGRLHQTGEYASRLDRLNVTSSPGVELQLVHAAADGWSAVASHPALPGLTCVVFAGEVSSPPITRKRQRRGAAGEIVCDQP